MYQTIKVLPTSEINLEDAINAELEVRAETHDLVAFNTVSVRLAFLVFKVKP